MRVLLTGAAGFLGSHALRHILTNTDWHVVCPVTFRHHGMPERIVTQLEGLDPERVELVRWDMTAPADDLMLTVFGEIDYVINYASESHVDRSIETPVPFVQHNVAIMLNVLELVRRLNVSHLIQISTDEVYGPAPAGQLHAEWSTTLPSNPYSASKAAQEAIAVAYWRTYGVPLTVVNSMNLIGETQDPEKFVPKTLRSLMRGEPVIVHAQRDRSVSGGWHVGSRFYMHARNLADAVLFLLRRGNAPMYGDAGVDRPDRWNVVGEREVDNDEMAQLIASYAGLNGDLRYVDYHTSRPGHDLRYALDGAKLAAAGWTPPIPLEGALKQTVEWTVAHPRWSRLML